VVCANEEAKKRLYSQFRREARAMYSNPPAHGAQIIAKVLNNPKLFSQWYKLLYVFAFQEKTC
jgi:aspartate/tyrosine/aromatic aminotransferase